MYVSLIVLQQPRDLSFYSLIKTAREAISSTHLDVLLGHNLYYANLKPLFLFQNLEFHRFFFLGEVRRGRHREFLLSPAPTHHSFPTVNIE